jgi:hypothetical protein
VPKDARKKRVIDPKGMKKVKAIDHCERCGRMSNGFYNLEVAHVKGKGCSGPDIKGNCLKLCGHASMSRGCHGVDHRGAITDNELFNIIAMREDKSLEVIQDIVHKAWRFREYRAGEET